MVLVSGGSAHSCNGERELCFDGVGWLGVERRFYINVLFTCVCGLFVAVYHFLVSVFFASMFSVCLIKASERQRVRATTTYACWFSWCVVALCAPTGRAKNDFLCWISFGFTIFLFFIFLSMSLLVCGVRVAQVGEQNTHIHCGCQVGGQVKRLVYWVRTLYRIVQIELWFAFCWCVVYDLLWAFCVDILRFFCC